VVISDDALVERARSGDRTALEALLRRHHDRVYSLCRRLAGNDSDALDATQEALMAIVRGLDRFDGRAAFTTWSHRVATNACLDEIRRRSRRPVTGFPDGDDGGCSPGETPTADRALDSAVADRLDIDAALSRVPVDFRTAVVLRDLCQLDYAEIAEVLGIPAGTVRSRIARGRAVLAGLLGGNRPGPDRRPSLDRAEPSPPSLSPTSYAPTPTSPTRGHPGSPTSRDAEPTAP